MLWLLILSLTLFQHVSATTILIFDEAELEPKKKTELLEVILKGEPPRVFYESEPFNLEAKIKEISSNIRLEWLPPTLWQLAVLHGFFHDIHIQRSILDLRGDGWDPLRYDEKLKIQLLSATNQSEVIRFFDEHTKSQGGIEELFYRVNNAVVKLYLRSNCSEEKMIDIIQSEIPPLSEWSKNEFPFLHHPYVDKAQTVDFLYKALLNKELITQLVKIEKQAHQNGEWVLYRGYNGMRLASTIQNRTTESHALSFGSTSLGGIFFAPDATALTYYTPDDANYRQGNASEWSFLILRVTPEEIKKFFRLGPIHPLIQMVSDGEMFHAHTKVAAGAADAYSEVRLHGYFMAENRFMYDSTGYILTSDMTVDELEKEFHLLCQRSGLVYSTGE